VLTNSIEIKTIVFICNEKIFHFFSLEKIGQPAINSTVTNKISSIYLTLNKRYGFLIQKNRNILNFSIFTAIFTRHLKTIT